jgi:hypothetical protein
MSTTYFAETGKVDCSCVNLYCAGIHKETIYIGRSSGGWCFSLNVIPKLNLNTLDNWVNYLKNKVIVNEYYDIISFEELLGIITKRYWQDQNSFRENDFYIKNKCERGPNNLVRVIKGYNGCIGHGEGTWDYVIEPLHQNLWMDSRLRS